MTWPVPTFCLVLSGGTGALCRRSSGAPGQGGASGAPRAAARRTCQHTAAAMCGGKAAPKDARTPVVLYGASLRVACGGL